jgi:membrane-bound inhibitor of C-type lysozyme
VNSQTTTSLTATPSPSVTGQAVTLTATVSPVAPGTGVPTGTVTFSDGATTLDVVNLNNGSASLTTSTLTVGSHSLTAVYSGGGNFLASTSAVVSHTVNRGSTSTSLTSNPNPSNLGQTVTLNATVSAVAPATGVPTGTVTFRDGATSLGVVNLNNGSASLTISTLAAGSHSLTAVYSGSGNFLASTSAAVTQTVNAPAAAATSTSLTSTPNPSTVGQAVTLSSTVTSAAGVPTGTVTFRDGATSLGVVTLNNGSALLTISTLAAGSHSLTAVYSGSATFAASTSPVVIQIVNAANGGADTVTINRAEFRANRGELRVEGVNSRTGNGNFAASVEIHNGAAAGNTCPGALIGTTAVSAADGSWRFRGTTNLAVTTVCVKSAGGGVASRTVTQK